MNQSVWGVHDPSVSVGPVPRTPSTGTVDTRSGVGCTPSHSIWKDGSTLVTHTDTGKSKKKKKKNQKTNPLFSVKLHHEFSFLRLQSFGGTGTRVLEKDSDRRVDGFIYYYPR